MVKCIQGIGWEYAAIEVDFQVGASTGCLFLSLKYHRLHPEYIHQRIKKSGLWNLKLLLVQCDVPDPQPAIKELTKVALVNGLTVLVAWSQEEAARYLVTFKAFEHKPSDLIQERRKEDWREAMTGVLTSVRGVNKTDSVGLLTRFGSLRKLAKASASDLSLVPGLGEIKVKRMREAITTPFRVGERRTYRERKAARTGRSSFATASDQTRGIDPNEDGDDDIEDEDDRISPKEQRKELSTSLAGNMAQTLKTGSAAQDAISDAANVQEPPLAAAPHHAMPSTSLSTSQSNQVIDDEDDDEFDLDEEELAALEVAEKRIPGLGGSSTEAARQPSITDKGDEENVASPNSLDEDLAGLEDLNEEEREELRQAMKMSLR